MPKISIIVPVYNAQNYLEHTLSCLQKQTLKDIEIICINDGSKDNSLNILEKYAKKDSRFKILNQKNHGQAVARNNGLKNASGKYIMFCDADACYDLRMCEKMYNTITNNDVDFVICDANVIDEEDNTHRRDLHEYYHITNVGEFLLTDDIKLKINTLIWNKIFKKSTIDQYNIVFPESLNHDDNGFFYCYLCVSQKIYFLNEKLYNYIRRSGSSITSITSNKKNDNYTLLNFHFVYDFMKRHNIVDENKYFFLEKYLGIFLWDYRSFTTEHQKTLTMQESNFLNTLQDILTKSDFKKYSLLGHILNADVKKINKKYLFPSDYKKISKFRKIKYKILSKITFGKIRDKYKQKYNKVGNI